MLGFRWLFEAGPAYVAPQYVAPMPQYMPAPPMAPAPPLSARG